MHIWKQWLDRPQSLWLRKALFQIHLWSGIALGLYVFIIGVSGSAAVFNSELYTAFYPQPRAVEIAGTRLTRNEIKAAAEKAHPHSTVTRVTLTADPHFAATVSFGAGVYAEQRFIDPYTGRDIGNARPFGLRMVSFFSQLHMNLLMDYRGRIVNGVGGILTTVLSLTGIVIWWPGIRRWRASLKIRGASNPKRLNWDLHSAIGFWTFALVLMWTVTGAYLVFPKGFDAIIKVVAGRAITLGQIPHAIHVGDFGGWPVKALWVILGLVPPLLFVTGFIMWWNRVVQPRLKRRPAVLRQPKPSLRTVWTKQTAGMKGGSCEGGSITTHDLRRSAITAMSEQGVTAAQAGTHLTGDVFLRYISSDVDERRETPRIIEVD